MARQEGDLAEDHVKAMEFTNIKFTPATRLCFGSLSFRADASGVLKMEESAESPPVDMLRWVGMIHTDPEATELLDGQQEDTPVVGFPTSNLLWGIARDLTS